MTKKMLSTLKQRGPDTLCTLLDVATAGNNVFERVAQFTVDTMNISGSSGLNLVSTLSGMVGVLNPGSPLSRTILDTMANFAGITVAYAMDKGTLDGLVVAFNDGIINQVTPVDPRRRFRAGAPSPEVAVGAPMVQVRIIEYTTTDVFKACLHHTESHCLSMPFVGACTDPHAGADTRPTGGGTGSCNTPTDHHLRKPYKSRLQPGVQPGGP